MWQRTSTASKVYEVPVPPCPDHLCDCIRLWSSQIWEKYRVHVSAHPSITHLSKYSCAHVLELIVQSSNLFFSMSTYCPLGYRILRLKIRMSSCLCLNYRFIYNQFANIDWWAGTGTRYICTDFYDQNRIQSLIKNNQDILERAV